jgi:hypothetical protein
LKFLYSPRIKRKWWYVLNITKCIRFNLANFSIEETNFVDVFKICEHENEFSCSCNLQWIVKDQRTAAYLYSNWCVNNQTKVNLDKLNFNEIGCSNETNVCSENFGVTIATEPVQHTPSILQLSFDL